MIGIVERLRTGPAPLDDPDLNDEAADEIEAHQGREAVATLASERAANALLTDEIERLRLDAAALVQLRAYAEALNARCIADTADAERYRWLRDNGCSDWAICTWEPDAHDGIGYYRDARAPAVVDAAIDAAMGAKP